MSSTLPPTTSLAQSAAASVGVEPLAFSYDPPVRGPVLLATDGGSATDAPLRAAKAIAERLGTTVDVIGVLEPFPSALLAPQLPIVRPDIEEGRRKAMRAAIEQRLDVLGGGAELWPVSIEYGETARTIAQVARERDSTLIVVGAGRHAPGERVYSGDRARRVIRRADRPVLVVHDDFVGLPKTAVVAVDFSAASVRAARAALLMLGKEGRLVLVHVRAVLELPTVPPTLVLRDTSFDALVSRWRTEEEAETAQLFVHLRDELRPYTPADVTIETRVRTGLVLSQLLGVAEDVGAELIAVGTHGPGIIERFFLGSVAIDVLRDSTHTVLVAPAPPPVESSRLELRLRGTAELRKPENWEDELEAFSKRNAGRRVRLEVDDPDLGAQVQETGFALLGVAYDRRDKSVEIMVGDPNERTRHLTRTIPRADDVAIYATPDGQERALRVPSGRGQTLLTFVD